MYFVVLVLFVLFSTSNRPFSFSTLLGTIHRISEAIVAISLASMIDQKIGLPNLIKWMFGKDIEVEAHDTSSETRSHKTSTMYRSAASDTLSDVQSKTHSQIEEDEDSNPSGTGSASMSSSVANSDSKSSSSSSADTSGSTSANERHTVSASENESLSSF